MTLRFRELPEFSKLFCDYAEGSERLRPIYAGCAEAETLQSRAAQLQTKSYPRLELADHLTRQAEELGCGVSVLANIEKLRNPDTVAVTASVAPGLLGGSLSSWFKALTAVRLAAWLSSQGTQAVSILFMTKPASREGLDVNLLARSGPTRFELKCTAGRASEIPPEIETMLHQVAQALEMGIEESDVLVALRAAYRPHTEFNIAWARFTACLFDSLGILLLDPARDEFQALKRRLLPPEQENIRTAWYSRQQGVLQAAGYDPFPSPRSADHSWESAELSILQSLFLPAVAQVISSRDTHDFICGQAACAGLNPIPPVGWPSVSASILDHSCRRLLSRIDLPFQDLFADPTVLTARLMQRMNSLRIGEQLEALKSELLSGVAELKGLIPAGVRFHNRVTRAGQRMSYQIEKLSSRSARAQRNRLDIRERQLLRLCAALAPWGRRQEEICAAFQFAVRHKAAHPRRLYEIIDPWKFEHQLIFLD